MIKLGFIPHKDGLILAKQSLYKYSKSIMSAQKSTRIVCPLVLLAGAVTGCSLPGYKERVAGDHWYNFGSSSTEEATYSDDLNKQQVTDYKPRLVKITPALIAHQKAERANVKLDPEVKRLTKAAGDIEYKIGPGDILNVTVYEHPELNESSGGSSSTIEGAESGDSGGQRVDSKGYMYYPYVGELKVSGLTLPELRRKLTQRLSDYIYSPQLDVTMRNFRSKRVYVSGDIAQPCTVALNDTNMTAVRALGKCNASSGGAKTKEGRGIGIRNIVLVRDGQSTMINLNDVASSGREVPLQANDRLLVDDTANRVYMVGEFEKQMALPFTTGGMSLSDAISDASGVNLTTGNTQAIYVIRDFVSGRDMSNGQVKTSMRPTVFKLDMSDPAGMLMANNFQLEPRDVVFAAPASLVNFNRALSLVMPSLDQIFRSIYLYDRFN